MTSAQLVCHRGFHDIHNKPHRPIENTLNAFIHAWSTPLNYTLCEGDVTISNDGILFFFHDDTFSSLLHPSIRHRDVHKPVCEWNWEDIHKHIVLLDGTRPCTLVEVLEGAKRLSGTTPDLTRKQMVVEFKTSSKWRQCIDAFYRDIFVQRADLVPYIRLGMSFDLRMLQRLRRLTPFPLVYIWEGKPLSHLIKYIVKENQLDGVYVQYDPFYRTIEGKRLLAWWKTAGLRIGIWNYATVEPDGTEWFEEIKEHVDFLNTDHVYTL